ncbi:MAG: rhomboid family intramembrane serine protease [Parachlamydiaceae bacterium]
MNYFSSSSIGPIITPKAIKSLIIATSLISIFSAGTQELFDMFGIFPGPQNILSLSWWGLHHWYLWQPLTCLFVRDPADQGLSFSFFTALFFDMYILWVVGTSVMEAIGKKSFLKLYLLGGIAAAVFSLLSMLITGQYEMVSGITPALLTIVVVWAMAFAETEIHLFFLIPFKAKRIVAVVVGALMLIALAHWRLSLFFLYVAAIAIGYGYSLIVWGWRSPFALTQPLDNWLTKIGIAGRRKPPLSDEGKIIDISSYQQPANDDAFVDAMLAKISRYGENSLSWSERRRLQKISEKKMHDKQ